ncbi:MAG: TIGR01777 family oxidoreductase, partial [Bacteroidota bacterium]
MKQKNVLIAGGTGLVGSHLSKLLIKKGYTVALLSRSKSKKDGITKLQWDLNEMTIDDRIKDYPIIINLAGAGIADKRWTDKRKKIIIESRVLTNQLLQTYFEKHQWKPTLYLSASAIGIYGNTGAQEITESSSVGTGFLAETTDLWEKAIDKVDAQRKVILRIGIVLSNHGGALPEMMKPIKFGSANYFNDGSHFTSWIHIEDLAQQIIFAIENEHVNGIYNGVAPNPVT